MYKITNISGGQLVCTLASGDTLRLDCNQSKDVADKEVTPYLQNVANKGIVLLAHVADKVSTENKKIIKKTAKAVNEKEE